MKSTATAGQDNVLSIDVDINSRQKNLNHAARSVMALMDEKKDIDSEIKRFIEEAELTTGFSKSAIRKAITSYYKYVKDTAKYTAEAQSFGEIFNVLMGKD